MIRGPACRWTNQCSGQIFIAAGPERVIPASVESEEAWLALRVLVGPAVDDRSAGIESDAAALLALRDEVVVLPALAAEGQRVEYAFTIQARLPLQRELPRVAILQGRVDRTARRKPLVKAKREDRLLRGASIVPRSQQCFETFPASLPGEPAPLYQLVQGHFDRRRLPAHEPPVGIVHREPEGLLDPGGERVGGHGFDRGYGRVGFDRGAEGVTSGRARDGGHPFQRLVDHVRDRDLAAEKLAGALGDDGPRCFPRRPGGEGGAGPDHLHVAASGLLDTAEEHGHVGALPAPMKVQLVNAEEAQFSGRRSQQRPFIRPQHHVFEHHVVGE